MDTKTVDFNLPESATIGHRSGKRGFGDDRHTTDYNDITTGQWTIHEAENIIW